MLTPTPLLNLFSEKLDELQQKAGEERKAPRLPTTEGGRVFPAAQLDGHICMGSGSQHPRKEDPGTPPASLSTDGRLCPDQSDAEITFGHDGGCVGSTNAPQFNLNMTPPPDFCLNASLHQIDLIKI